MKFAHIADTHLGYEQYHLPFRADDFAKAFKSVVEKTLEEDVDFVIISGDLFHKSNPNPKTIKQAMEVLSILKGENVPIFAIEGNHDKTVKEVSIYDLLESLGLLYKLGLRRTFKESEYLRFKKLGDYKMVYAELDGYKIFGDTHRTSHQFKSLMEERYIPDCDVAVLHLSVKEVVDFEIKDDYVTIRDLPKAKYYALGHVHLPICKELNGSWYVYPGCPERSDAREYSLRLDYFDELEVSEGCKKGFFVVKNFKPKFIEVGCRDLVYAVVYARDQKDAVEKLREIRGYLSDEAIFSLKLLSEGFLDIESLLRTFEGRVKYVNVKFERVGRERKVELKKPNEFFTDFEMTLFEYLKRQDFNLDVVLGIVEREFGIGDFKTLRDFEVKGRNKEEKVEKKVDKRGKRTLFDFLEVS